MTPVIIPDVVASRMATVQITLANFVFHHTFEREREGELVVFSYPGRQVAALILMPSNSCPQSVLRSVPRCIRPSMTPRESFKKQEC